MKIHLIILAVLLLIAPAALRAQAPELERAIAQLESGNHAAARDAFLAIVATDARNAQAWHGAGLSILHLGDAVRAMPHFQKAHTIAPQDRAVCINYAAALIKARNPMRAIRVLTDAQPRADQPVDEPLLNALQYALAAVDEAGRRNRIWTEGHAAALASVGRLESARPGWKRFGAEWRSASEVDAITTQNQSTTTRLQKLTADLEVIERQLQQLAAEARVIEKRVQHGFDWPGRLDAHNERMRGVERQAQRLVAEVEQLQAAVIPEPPMQSLELVAINAPAPRFEAWAPPVDPPATAPAEPEVDSAPLDPPTTAIPVPVPPVAAPPTTPAKPEQLTRQAVGLAITQSQLVVPAADIADGLLIEVRQGAVRPMTARHIRTDRETGLAIIEITGGKLRPAPLAAATAVGRVRIIDFPQSSLFDVISRGGDAELKRVNDRWQLAPSATSPMNGAILTSDDGVVGLMIDSRRRAAIDVAAIRAALGNTPQGAEPAHDPADAVYHVTIVVPR